jgi:hypothetical protein
MMAQAKASDYQLDADANKNEIPDQVRNDKRGIRRILFVLRGMSAEANLR